MIQQKNILIIGKNGQLGSALADNAARRGYEAFAYDRAELDVTDIKSLRQCIDQTAPAVVINATAYHVLRDCENHPETAYGVNAIAPAAIAAMCRDKGIRFITYSTDYVFDGKKNMPYHEDDAPRPLQVYGVSKLAGEYESQNAYADTLVIRTCGLYGGMRGSPMKGGNFVINILREAKEKNHIEVRNDQMVSPTSSRDLAGATYELLDRQATGGIYHLVNEGACSWYEFTQEIFRIASVSTRITPVKGEQGGARALRPLFSALANTRAKSLGIVLPSWQEGVRTYLDEIMLRNR